MKRGKYSKKAEDVLIDICRAGPILFKDYLTIRPIARKGYGSIAHEAKPNWLLTRGP